MESLSNDIREHKMEQIRGRFSYQFYLKVKGTYVEISDEWNEENVIRIITSVHSVKDLFDGDIIKTEYHGNLYLTVKTGEGHKIEDLDQFISDLTILKKIQPPLIEPKERFSFKYEARDYCPY